MTTVVFLLFLFNVRGVVSDPTGRPVPGAIVACGAQTQTTDSTGAFELPNPCDATITKAGFAPAKISLKETNQITLALATASDRVLVTATGAPIALDEAGVAADVF